MPEPPVTPGSASVAGLQRAMAAGTLTSAEVTAFYRERISRLNPALHAVITVDPSAAEQARASDAARLTGGPRSSLEGIPVLVKDNVEVAGMPTTAGSPALLDAPAGQDRDAFIVTRLRQAGAVIVGKANLSEWANFRSTHGTSGWSTLGGQTANPFALERNPSGSSSGSAAGVAAGLAPMAVGTETDGSIVCPSSVCGVVGIKPTLGLVSRSGIVPISAAQDTAGPMARTVTDAAALLSILAAADPDDPAARLPGRETLKTSHPADYTVSCDAGALRGARVGVWRAPSARAGAATAAVLDQAVARLCEQGAHVIDPVELPGAEKIGLPEVGALLHEFKHDIGAYLAGRPGGQYRTLADLISFNERNAGLVLARFGHEVFEKADATSGDLADPAYRALRADAARLARQAMETPLVTHRLDAIVALTASPAWLTDYTLGDHDVFHTSGPAAVGGYPAVSLPFGYVWGLPVGVSFMGAKWSEPRLIALAYAFEQAAAIGGRPPAASPAPHVTTGSPPALAEILAPLPARSGLSGQDSLSSWIPGVAPTSPSCPDVVRSRVCGTPRPASCGPRRPARRKDRPRSTPAGSPRTTPPTSVTLTPSPPGTCSFVPGWTRAARSPTSRTSPTWTIRCWSGPTATARTGASWPAGRPSSTGATWRRSGCCRPPS